MRTKAEPRPSDTRRIKAMSHPKRRAALKHYRDRGPKAPIEVAAELGLTISDVSYHTRELAKLGCIELVKTEQVRGSTKHWYVAVEQHLVDTGEWEDLDPMVREGVLVDVFQPVVDDFTAAVKSGTLGDDDRFHVTRTPLKSVDQEGFAELLAAHMRLYDEVIEISRRSAERMADDEGGSISVSSGQSCFVVDSF